MCVFVYVCAGDEGRTEFFLVSFYFFFNIYFADLFGEHGYIFIE